MVVQIVLDCFQFGDLKVIIDHKPALHAIFEIPLSFASILSLPRYL